MTLAGKVAIVTGASRGIGAATVRCLAADGASVVLVARDADRMAMVAETIPQARAIAADLHDHDSIGALVDTVAESYGRVDILINNAGVLPAPVRVQDIPIDAWERTLALNITAPWLLSARAYPLMGPGSVVVNVASTAAVRPSAGRAHYSVSKAALVMLTRALAAEWARTGVRVVGVIPGVVDTEMVQPILAYYAQRQQPPNPQNRAADPSEVADLIAYLVSDRAAFMTGSMVTMDGGELLDGEQP